MQCLMQKPFHCTLVTFKVTLSAEILPAKPLTYLIVIILTGNFYFRNAFYTYTQILIQVTASRLR